MGRGGPVVWENHDAAAWRQILGLPSVHLFATIGSTNDVARELAEQGAPSLTLVVADHQTSGRGRAGRSWLSTPGSSLLCSVVFRVADMSDAAPGATPVRIGCAVAEAVAEVASVDTRVKWPNDVVIPHYGKVAGILCEAVMRQESAFVIAGIGVNINSPGGPYTSLRETTSRKVSRGDLLQRIIDKLRNFADDVAQPLSTQELGSIRARDILFGQKVTDETGLVGIAEGIAPDGSMLVRTQQGTAAVYNATIRLAETNRYPGANV